MALSSLMRPKRSTGEQAGNAGAGGSSASPTICGRDQQAALGAGRQATAELGSLRPGWDIMHNCKAQGQKPRLWSALDQSLVTCLHELTWVDLLPHSGYVFPSRSNDLHLILWLLEACPMLWVPALHSRSFPSNHRGGREGQMQCNGVLVPILKSSVDMDSGGKSQWGERRS